MEKATLHVVFEHGEVERPYGASYIRDILPLTHPLNAEAFSVTYGPAYAPADVVIVERLWKPDLTPKIVEDLVRRSRRDGACLVYSIDDVLLDLEHVSVDQRMLVRYFAREANGIIVSTENLRRRLSRLNDKVVVVANALDEHLFTERGARVRPRPRDDGRKVIGYMGTFTHDGDLMMVLQALRQVLGGHGGSVEFELVGGTGDPSVIEAFRGLHVRVLHLDPIDTEYPRFVPWMFENMRWDLGIAPLEDSVLNQYKSDIKFLDYSALGIPGIYSRVPAYQGTVRDGENGRLVPNTPEAWAEALEFMLTDDRLRDEMAGRAQEYVFGERTLEHRATDWRKAILEIWGST